MSLTMAGAMAVATLTCAAPGSPTDSLDALYQQGRTYAAFLDGARARRSQWLQHSAGGAVDGEALARARAAGAGWRLLVVLEDSCGDSVNTIPYVAALVDSLGGAVELRLVNSRVGRWVMERYRTGDGRAATPTVVLLDPSGEPMGCWVERPAPLAAWERVERPRLSQEEFVRRKFDWYAEDHGASTQREVAAMLEQAAPGAACLGNVR